MSTQIAILWDVLLMINLRSREHWNSFFFLLRSFTVTCILKNMENMIILSFFFSSYRRNNKHKQHTCCIKIIYMYIICMVSINVFVFLFALCMSALRLRDYFYIYYLCISPFSLFSCESMKDFLVCFFFEEKRKSGKYFKIDSKHLFIHT